MKLSIFGIVRNHINKDRVLIVRKGYHNVNHFSTIGNFYHYITYASLDIFRLGNILSHSMGKELIHINPFLASVPILYPLKTPGTQKASGDFRKYKMRVMAQNDLIKFIMQR